MRLKEIKIDMPTLSVTQKMERGKILIVILDGVQGKAKMTEAVEHGSTIIETAKGKVAEIKYDDGELF